MIPAAAGVTAEETAIFDGDADPAYHGAGTGTCHLIMTVHLPPGSAPHELTAAVEGARGVAVGRTSG